MRAWSIAVILLVVSEGLTWLDFSGIGAASDKVAALEKAGAIVSDSPAKLGSLLLKAMQDAGLH